MGAGWARRAALSGRAKAESRQGEKDQSDVPQHGQVRILPSNKRKEAKFPGYGSASVSAFTRWDEKAQPFDAGTLLCLSIESS